MTTSVAMYPEVERYIQALSREFTEAVNRASAAAGRGAPGGTYGSRDLGPGGFDQPYGATPPAGGAATMPPGGAATMPPGGAATLPEVKERFLPVLAALLPTLVSAVPTIIQSIQGKNRDIITMSQDPEQIQRDFLSVLGALTPELIHAIPHIIGTLANNRDLPADDEEVNTRWLGALVSIAAPYVIKAAPKIISAFAGGRRDLATRVYEPEAAERFLGPLLGAVLPAFAKAVPDLIQTFTGRRYLPQT